MPRGYPLCYATKCDCFLASWRYLFRLLVPGGTSLSRADIIKVLSMCVVAPLCYALSLLLSFSPLLIKTIADSWVALKTVSLFCLTPTERASERGRADNGIMAASYWREWSEREKSAVNRLKTVREHDMNEPQLPYKIYHESLVLYSIHIRQIQVRNSPN